MKSAPRILMFSAMLCLASQAFGRADIYRIQVDGAIDPITAEYVRKGIRKANDAGAQFILLRLDTPGGFGSSMRDIISAMLNSGVPVVVHVAPSGSSAASAGFFILMASDVAVMAPGTNTGAAHPLLSVAGFPIEGGEAGKTLTEKVTSDATAFLRSITSKRHRNVEEAEKAVVQSKSFTETEALAGHLIDFVVREEGELFALLQGYKVQLFTGKSVTLAPQGTAVVEVPMTAREQFLATISQPNLALILGVVGLVLLYFEFTHPGMVAPGVIGGISFLLSILGFSFLPINYVGVLLILLAIGLFIAEVKVQGFGVLGLGGVVAMVVGMLILVDSEDPAVRIGIATAISAALPFACIFIILLVAILRSYRQKAATGAAGMLGLVGVTDCDVHIGGRVKVHGEYWRAHSALPIPAGRRVRVIGIEDLNLRIEEVKE